MPLYVATSNPGKLRDFARAASSAPEASHIRIEPLPDLERIPAPPENSPYFEGNARAKAAYYARFAPGSLVIADDSGLEVEALDGAPGVRSARFADDLNFISRLNPTAPTDERNNLCLLDALANVPPIRKARYRCVLALAMADEQTPEALRSRPDRTDHTKFILVSHGIVEGHILTAPRGVGGFGYDPLFFLPDLGQTMAELDPVTRLAYSHRGRALRNLFEHLQNSPDLFT
jgi:XTP/dITP diphosphohydrolase